MFLIVSLISLVTAISLTTCPSQLFQTVNAYDQAANIPGLNVPFWWQGCDLISNIGSTFAPAGGNNCSSTTITTAAGALSATAFAVPSLATLQAKASRDQQLFIFTQLSTTSTSGCFLTVGQSTLIPENPASIPATSFQRGSFCLSQSAPTASTSTTPNGFVSFPDFFEFPINFGSTPSGIPTLAVGIYIRRYLDAHNNILFDFKVQTGSSSVAAGTAVRVNGAFFDIDPSSTLQIGSTSGDNSSTTFGTVIVVAGDFNPALNQTVDSVLANGIAFVSQSGQTQCVDETWTTNNGFTVPTGTASVSNTKLTYTRTVFGAEESLSHFPLFTPLTDATNATRNALFLAGYQIQPPATLAALFADGVTTTRGGVAVFSIENTTGVLVPQFNATLANGQSVSLTFTFGVEQCTLTALPLEFGATPFDSARYALATTVSGLLSNAIGVQTTTTTSAAYVFIQRQSRLVPSFVDTRGFDSNGRPIASGCNVSLSYTFDVFNAGPSCASGLNFNTLQGILAPPGVTVTSPAFFIIPGDLLPGTMSTAAPITIVINANATTPNIGAAPRFVTLNAPTSDCISSDDTAGACVTSTSTPLFKQFYDVQAYADISITSTQVLPAARSAIAGDFSTPLEFALNVTSHGCSPLDNVTIDIDIETPEGVVFFDIDTDGALNNKSVNYGVQTFVDERFIRRTVNLGSFAPNQSKIITLEFTVCQNARAGNGGVRIIARFSPRPSFDNLDQNDLQTTALFIDNATSTIDYKVTNVEDDQTTIVGKLINSATLTMTHECTEPVLVPRGVRPEFVLDDDDNAVDELAAAEFHHHKEHKRPTDVKLQKFSVCTLSLSNTGASNVALRLRNEWDIPSGVHVAKWETSAGVFSNNIWVVDAPSTAGGDDANLLCPARSSAAPPTLKLTLVANTHGIVQWVTKLDTAATAASFNSTSDTGKFTSIVF